MKKINLAVFISGNGYLMQTVVNYSKNNNQKCFYTVPLVISNTPQKSSALEFTKSNGIDYYTLDYKDFTSREDLEAVANAHLLKHNIDLILLASFDRILSPKFVGKWRDKIINIHGSLLPAFKGKKAVEQAYKYGVAITGCTIHYVDEEVDAGPIIYQAATKIEKGESVNDLIKKVFNLSKKAVIPALELVCEDLVESQKKD